MPLQPLYSLPGRSDAPLRPARHAERLKRPVQLLAGFVARGEIEPGRKPLRDCLESLALGHGGVGRTECGDVGEGCHIAAVLVVNL